MLLRSTVVNCVKYRSSVVAIVFSLIVWALIIYRHKDNVIRFIHGKENTLSIVGKNEVKEIDENASAENTQAQEVSDCSDKEQEDKQ